MINKKQLLHTRQYGSEIGSFFKNIFNSQFFKTSIKSMKDEAHSTYNTMIKPLLELHKNRAIEYGKDWIDYNQRDLNNMRSLKDTVSNNKIYFNKRLDEQRKGLLDAMILGEGFKIHPRWCSRWHPQWQSKISLHYWKIFQSLFINFFCA